ncbi:MAG: vitamin K epoxide reductase family protein [Chthoniobacterales bacterium]
MPCSDWPTLFSHRDGSDGPGTVFSCAVFAAFGRARARFFLNFVVTLMFLGTLWFLYVQAFSLHQYCRYCLFSAAMTGFLPELLVATTPGRPRE